MALENLNSILYKVFMITLTEVIINTFLFSRKVINIIYVENIDISSIIDYYIYI